MIQRVHVHEDGDEPVCPLERMTEAERNALTEAELNRIYSEWVERFLAWSREFQRRARADIRELERTRGFFGITTSV